VVGQHTDTSRTLRHRNTLFEGHGPNVNLRITTPFAYHFLWRNVEHQELVHWPRR
jgi:hypothetical protein